jgi:hypothetical protein
MFACQSKEFGSLIIGRRDSGVFEVEELSGKLSSFGGRAAFALRTSTVLNPDHAGSPGAATCRCASLTC